MTNAVTHWADGLARLDACHDAVAWARDFDSLDAAWAACERGDWMLWLAGKTSGEPMSEQRKRVVLAACACARLALPHVRAGEERPLRAIELAERWARGEADVSRQEMRAADAADAAYAAAAYAAYAACGAAAAYAAYAAAYAADAAYAYGAAADAADAAYARKKILRECADLVRRHYPSPPEITEGTR
jgi:hypothetical protein